MPRLPSRSAAALKELPDRPGPSSATRNAPLCAARIRFSSRDARIVLANGSPVGLKVSGAGEPVAAATAAARLVPMLRSPTTSGGWSQTWLAAAAA